jgi:hypothetical protein
MAASLGVSSVSCQLGVEFCTGGCENGTRTREAEASPLLEADTRERLMQTQQVGRKLSGAMVICKLSRLAVAL